MILYSVRVLTYGEDHDTTQSEPVDCFMTRIYFEFDEETFFPLFYTSMQWTSQPSSLFVLCVHCAIPLLTYFFVPYRRARNWHK
jgi:hypothetical protein